NPTRRVGLRRGRGFFFLPLALRVQTSYLLGQALRDDSSIMGRSLLGRPRRNAMADSSTEFRLLLARMQDGDEKARNELFRHMAGQLERLTRKMLRQFPGVRRWAGTDDVLQSALIRLLRTLEAV